MTAQSETDFLASIRSLSEYEQALAEGVHDSWFVERLPVWRWLADYVGGTGEYPPLSLIAQQFPDFQPSPAVGAMAYHLERSYEEHLRRVMSRYIESALRRIIDNPSGKVKDTLSYLTNSLLDLASERPSQRVYVDADAMQRLEEFEVKAQEAQEMPVRGIPTGIEPIDIMGRGLMPGNLCAVVARPGVGKTQLLVNASAAAWLAGYRVVYFTFEMTKEEILGRIDPLLATEFGIEGPTNTELQSAVVSEPHLHNYRRLINKLSGSDRWLLVDGSDARLQITDVQAVARQHRADLVIVDGAKLLAAEAANNEWERYSGIIRGLKRMAMRNGYAVIIVEHASMREKRKDKQFNPPGLDDVFMGQAIAQESDMFISVSAVEHEPLARWIIVPKYRGAITIDDRKMISCDVNRGDVGRWIDDDKRKQNSELAPWLRAPEAPPVFERKVAF